MERNLKSTEKMKFEAPTELSAKKGVVLAIAAAVISGWAVFINKFALANWTSSDIYTTEKNMVAALILTVVFAGFLYRKEIFGLPKKEWGRLALIGLIGGSLPFVLFFKGLSLASSSGAAFFHKTLFVWVAILAIPILKEKLSKMQLFAFGILIIGNISLFYPKELYFDTAGVLILTATVIWALENVLAKKFMNTISAPVMAWGRMFFGSIFLIGYLFFVGRGLELAHISLVQLPWLLLVGITLFLYVTFWYSGLKRVPAVVATSILTIASPITTVLNNIYSGVSLPANFWLIFSLILLGIVTLTFGSLRNSYNAKKSLI